MNVMCSDLGSPQRLLQVTTLDMFHCIEDIMSTVCACVCRSISILDQLYTINCISLT